MVHLQELLVQRERAIEEGIHEAHYHPGPDTVEFWWMSAVAFGFLCLAGLASGLTVGLMGIDRTDLRLKLVGPDEVDRKRAARILKITEDHHRLLITLLLANTAANECLPIVLDRLVPAWLAIVLSIFGVLVFGEILPMSVLTGPRQLELVANISCVVEGMMKMLSCAAVPVAALLDYLVGSSHRNKVYSRRELQCLLQMSVPRRALYSAAGTGLLDESDDERLSHHPSQIDVHLAVSALDFSTRSSATCVKGLNEVFMLDSATPFDQALLQRIREEGYSRVPVYTGRRDRIVGVLLAKALVGVSPRPDLTIKKWVASRVPPSPQRGSDSEGSPARALREADEAAGDAASVSSDAAQPWLRPLVVGPDLSLPRLVERFRSNDSGCQMALVVHESKVLGIVTMNDALAEVMPHALEDEFDKLRRSQVSPDGEWLAWSRLAAEGPKSSGEAVAEVALPDASSASTFGRPIDFPSTPPPEESTETCGLVDQAGSSGP